MSIWTTKFRIPALAAGVLAISLAASPAFAKSKVEPRSEGSVRGGVGFTSGALVGAAAAGPLGAVVGGSIGAMMGERSQKKHEALAKRRVEAELLANEVESLNHTLSAIEGNAGQVGATVQFRTGETGVRDTDRARLARLGALVAEIEQLRVRVSGFADARGNEELNLALSKERAEMVARELEKAGIPKERLIVEAMGERFASTEAIADDQAFERSVEIRFETGTALARSN